MFITNLDSFKIQQEELHRRAEKYRLAKVAAKPPRRLERIYTAIGNTLVMLGQQMLSRTQTAY